jgi:ATP-dependent RNA helicase SUPV3L1/SUV3
VTQATLKTHDTQALDALTGGAFTAPTSGERAARLRDWLAKEPAVELLQEVFRELSGRDKGAARVVRERLDEIKRAKGQEAIAAEWADKAQGLLAQAKLNIADAMAWQRDAARAGAPLSREPLAGLKAQLAERIKGIEDLQHRVQVQREAAVLLAQRIEVLSTKSWRDAQAVCDALRTDVPDWQAQADTLVHDPIWTSVDVRFPPLLEASRNQLQVVWEAFQAALAIAAAADSDPAATLPPVPVWADELRAARGLPAEAPLRPAARPKVDPALRDKANEAVRAALSKVEQEVAEGHGKASAGAAAALRNALKEHGRLVDDKLANQAHAALTAAGEMEGWQRWRTDQLRQELVAKAEALFEQVAPARGAAPAPASAPQAVPAAQTTPEITTEATPDATPEVAQDANPQVAQDANPQVTQDAAPDVSANAEPASMTALDADGGHAPSTPAAEVPPTMASPAPAAAAEPARVTQRKPRYGGRKMQEQLRGLRDQWKQLDQTGAPNHGLWKRFDGACNEAYKVVEAWLDKVKSEAADHRDRRMALIDEVKAWAAANVTARDDDWKGFARIIHQFENRWREAGHLGEKAFAELQPLWKATIQAAEAPLDAIQKQSLERRHAMIDEAKALGAQPQLRIDAVKALQQRWQAEAQTVPLDRKYEQKLWDAFRKPIDEAFERKTQDRERAATALSDHDRVVLEASKALEAANASGDAQKIRAAIAGLDAALKGQAQARADVAQAAALPAAAPSTADAGADAAAPEGSAGEPATAEGEAAPAPAAAPKPAPKPVIAMRGDDRPGMRKTEPALPSRGGRFGDRKPGAPPSRFGDRAGAPGGRDAGRGGSFGDREFEDRGPRLGDVAFRAQRDALDHAQQTLRKLAAQAHGEALTLLLGGWEQRAPDQVPSQSELGKSVAPAVRGSWVQAIGAAPSGDASEALLRLEMAAEAPTPAEHLDARRALQLKLLTRRNDPSPAQTWGQDAASVLATAHSPQAARRLQNVLKALLR